MYNFCTLFDSNYLSRGVAMYRSLEQNCSSFHLYVFAFDKKTEDVLAKLQLKHATVISLNDFEDEHLLKVKPTRTPAEYCWTSTSSTILYVLEKYKVESCTYIDADLIFYSSPAPLFDELGNRSILITEHRYTPMYNKDLKSGTYCVQFVTFKNDERGLKALHWWREQCLEWCYARFEDGKFGDQLYLEDWVTRFAGVHVLQHLGGGIASWNVQQYDFYDEFGKLFLVDIERGNEYEVIFYHFHYVRLYTNGTVDLGRRLLSRKVMDKFYIPYLKQLETIKKEINAIDPSFDPHGAKDYTDDLKSRLITIYRKFKKVYNVFPLNNLLEERWPT